MRDNPGSIIVLLIVALLALAIEFGLVSGGVFDVIRIVFIVALAVIVFALIALVIFLIYAGKHQDDLDHTHSNSNVTVRRASDGVYHVGAKSEEPVSINLQDTLVDVSNSENQVSDAEVEDALAETERAAAAIKSSTETLSNFSAE